MRRFCNCSIIVFTYVCLTYDAHAAYSFVKGNPRQEMHKMYGDLSQGRLGIESFTQETLGRIKEKTKASPNLEVLSRLGPLKKACLAFGIKSNGSRRISFRTIHEAACGDWIITVDENTEIISNIVLIPMFVSPDSCGAPAILPPPPGPGSNASFYIPPTLDCAPMGLGEQ